MNENNFWNFRLSVKHGIGVYLFCKECCFRVKFTCKSFKNEFRCLLRVFSGTAFSIKYLWNLFNCYGSKPESHYARNLREFGVARRWIALHIASLSSQSERAKNTIPCFSTCCGSILSLVKFYFLLLLCMDMTYDNEFETKENKL